MTEDEMAGWHHRLDGHEFEQAVRVCDGQGSLACHSPWDRKESDITEQLNCSTRFPGTHSSSRHPEFPQGLLKVNSHSSPGFSLHRGRWQMPLLFSRWQCSW